MGSPRCGSASAAASLRGRHEEEVQRGLVVQAAAERERVEDRVVLARERVEAGLRDGADHADDAALVLAYEDGDRGIVHDRGREAAAQQLRQLLLGAARHGDDADERQLDVAVAPDADAVLLQLGQVGHVDLEHVARADREIRARPGDGALLPERRQPGVCVRRAGRRQLRVHRVP